MAQVWTDARPLPKVSEKTDALPWYVWNFTLAVACVTVGGAWDISWHLTVGRDTFLTPAHLLIYLCGILGGLGAAALILRTTFDDASPLRASSVKMWGFHGPLGAFVAAWGATAMIVSAPFDDWWHNAYGLDVKVLSPPHVVLILGIMAILLGAILLVLGEMNRSDGARRAKLLAVFLFLGAIFARNIYGVFMLEFMARTMQHSARFYLVAAIAIPVGAVAIARASRTRWAMTAMALITTAISLAFLWVLPLFPAEPKLGPVYQNITHFIPPGGFPLLIVVPFFVLDYLSPRLERLGDWTRAVVSGVLFLAVFAAVQWPFADFLMSEGARNWFFGSHYLPYFARPEGDSARNVYTIFEASSAQFWQRIAMAVVFAVLSVRAGLGWGKWMLKVQR